MKKGKMKQLMVGMGLSSMLLLNACGGEALPDTPLDGTTETAGEAAIFPVAKVLEIVSRENDVARTLYTKGIVGPGKKQGIKFDENWRKDDVEAGPLPALFLRGISSDIQKGDVPLGLFLGSDFPINAANKFEGKQAELFAEIKADSKHKFFYDEASSLHTAMFPDFAAAAPCVTCHNEHAETTKNDWVLGDIMGATTWTYPKEMLTFSEVQGVINAYRKGIVNTLGEYVSEIEGFKNSPKPEIGDKWPSEGLYIPSPEAFLDSVKVLASTQTLDGLLAE